MDLSAELSVQTKRVITSQNEIQNTSEVICGVSHPILDHSVPHTCVLNLGYHLYTTSN